MSVPSARAPRLLILEDDPVLCELLDLVLRAEGYEVLIAPTDAAAQALQATPSCDLVLTALEAHTADDHIGALHDLHALAGDRPLGVMTAGALSADEARRQGAAFLVRKPFNLDHLLLSIAISLARPLSPAQESQAQVVQRYFAVLAAHDWDALLALCAEDITYVLPGPAPFAATVRGKDAFRAYTAKTYRHFPATQFSDVQLYATPHGLAARYHASWRAPAGALAQHEGIVLFTFAGAQIAQIGVYLEARRLRALLQAPPTPPTTGV